MKRMTNKFWLVVLTILLSISCAKEELAYDLAENNSQDILRDYSLPQEEAIQIFEQYMKALNTEGTTRNVVSKTTMITKINRVDISRYLSDNSPVTRGTMKSQTGIPMYEITTQNSANTNGFAVVVGDKRFPEVIAYAPFGSITDTVENKGLAMFFREAADIISQTLNPPLKTRQSVPRQNSENDILVENWESLSAAFFEPVGEPTIIAYCYEEDLQLGDELPWWVNQFPSYSSSWMSELVPQLVPYVWHQRAPYNNQVPVYTNIDGQIVRAPIGCVALAMGTVMAYHRYPLQYDWMAITSYGSIPATPIKTPQKAVSKMLLDVANTVNTRWSIAGDGSGAGSVEGSPQVVGDLIKDGLQQLGYSSDVVENTSSSNLLDLVVLKENLQQGLPVIICSRGSSGGHAWVADGLISRNRYMDYSGWANYDIVGQRPGSHSVFIRERQEQVATQIHYVWGWTNGQGNGWYYSFKPMNVTRDDITFTRYAKIMCANIKPTIK